MPSLRLHALAWLAGRSRLALPHDVTIGSGQLAVVAAAPDAGAALADVILGLAAPLGGRVRCGGRDVTDLPPGTRGIALVPVGGALLPHLTVERNVAYAGDPRHARDRIRELHLDGIRDLRPHELSPAQTLQTAMARALCRQREPGVIVYEDRSDQPPYRVAVETARAHGSAVLVITDLERAATLDDVVRPEEIGDAT